MRRAFTLMLTAQAGYYLHSNIVLPFASQNFVLTLSLANHSILVSSGWNIFPFLNASVKKRIYKNSLRGTSFLALQRLVPCKINTTAMCATSFFNSEFFYSKNGRVCKSQSSKFQELTKFENAKKNLFSPYEQQCHKWTRFPYLFICMFSNCPLSLWVNIYIYVGIKKTPEKLYISCGSILLDNMAPVPAYSQWDDLLKKSGEKDDIVQKGGRGLGQNHHF